MEATIARGRAPELAHRAVDLFLARFMPPSGRCSGSACHGLNAICSHRAAARRIVDRLPRDPDAGHSLPRRAYPASTRPSHLRSASGLVDVELDHQVERCVGLRKMRAKRVAQVGVGHLIGEPADVVQRRARHVLHRAVRHRTSTVSCSSSGCRGDRRGAASKRARCGSSGSGSRNTGAASPAGLVGSRQLQELLRALRRA